MKGTDLRTVSYSLWEKIKDPTKYAAPPATGIVPTAEGKAPYEIET
jgi:hypothetical protein